MKDEVIKTVPKSRKEKSEAVKRMIGKEKEKLKILKPKLDRRKKEEGAHLSLKTKELGNRYYKSVRKLHRYQEWLNEVSMPEWTPGVHLGPNDAERAVRQAASRQTPSKQTEKQDPDIQSLKQPASEADISGGSHGGHEKRPEAAGLDTGDGMVLRPETFQQKASPQKPDKPEKAGVQDKPSPGKPQENEKSFIHGKNPAGNPAEKRKPENASEKIKQAAQKPDIPENRKPGKRETPEKPVPLTAVNAEPDISHVSSPAQRSQTDPGTQAGNTKNGTGNIHKFSKKKKKKYSAPKERRDIKNERNGKDTASRPHFESVPRKTVQNRKWTSI